MEVIVLLVVILIAAATRLGERDNGFDGLGVTVGFDITLGATLLATTVPSFIVDGFEVAPSFRTMGDG
jgi:hypothetical protein